eukprot:2133510-Ditylum_brightwellii.AAC.1
MSVKLLHVISQSAGLNALCGDIVNSYFNAFTTKKMYAVAGPEFGPGLEGKVVVICKALYGLATLCAQFHNHLSDMLRGMEFKPTQFDCDVWIRLRVDKKSYEYICTHIDDFCIFSKQADNVMAQIKAAYTVKSVGPPKYYLGNYFKCSTKGRWHMGCKKYITKEVTRVQMMFGNLVKRDTPMAVDNHPEMDDSEVLNGADHQKYQMLLGMLNWIVILGRLGIACAASLFACFAVCPRKGHNTR